MWATVRKWTEGRRGRRLVEQSCKDMRGIQLAYAPLCVSACAVSLDEFLLETRIRYLLPVSEYIAGR